MRSCRYCEKQLDENLNFCPHCGKPIEKIESGTSVTQTIVTNTPRKNKKIIIFISIAVVIALLISVIAFVSDNNKIFIDKFTPDMTWEEVQDKFGDPHAVSGWDEGYWYTYMGLDGELKVSYENGFVSAACWVYEVSDENKMEECIDKAVEMSALHIEKLGEPDDEVTSDDGSTTIFKWMPENSGTAYWVGTNWLSDPIRLQLIMGVFFE